LKKKNKFGAIDIGSYNCRLLIAEKSGKIPKVLSNFSLPTNLIKNLSYNNEFNEDNISKTIKCLENFSKRLKKYNVLDYRCIATEACRSVTNPDFFLKKVKEKTGLNVEIISSNEEARLSLQSSEMYVKKINGDGFIFDIGGGSTELTYFKNHSSDYKTRSISYGVINLTEKKEIFSKIYVENHLQKHFSQFKQIFKNNNQKFITIGSCSTVTSICSVFLNLSFYDPHKIEGFEMKIDDLENTLKYIEKMSVSDMINHPCIGSKHELLSNGIFILKQLIKIIPVKKLIVTQNSLRDAIITEIHEKYERKNS